ncbi:MAG: non-homologous end-joining DNA ligase [Acidimicrobiia bacterium]
MIRFGISGLPPEDGDDAAYLDRLVERGHTAYELAFVTGFPWKERRCARFGELAGERDVWLSVHAPYFAVLTVEEEDKARQCLAALEHTMKLGRGLGSRIVCAHFGHTKGRPAEELMGLIRARLEYLAPKVAHLGVGLGLETGGNDRSFGTLGDIAELAVEFPFVRPIVDWAHVHAMTGGALTSKEAFASVIAFVRDQFPGWMVEPLQTQFTDNLFNQHGEVKHIPYGTGTLKVGPLVEAAGEASLPMVVISEAREQSSHDAIWEEIRRTLRTADASEQEGRLIASGRVEFPEPVRAVREGSHWKPLGLHRALRVSNLDKPFFPDGQTKGDLIQYYASAGSLLLPHLAGRAIVMARYPDGAGGPSFYEKRAPGHQPDWMPTAPIPSDHGSTDYLMAPDRESLMWFANMGCIEFHPWHSRAATLDHPDYAIFDFDPAEGSTWEQVVVAAKLARVALERLGLRGYPKLSGGRGLHVYVPLAPVYRYSRVRRFVEAVGRVMVSADPSDLTMEWDIGKRRGKVFIDHNRNARGQTIASVYSVRPRAGAPVSTPVLWEELEEARPEDFTIATVWDRFQRYGDLFAPVIRGGQALEAAVEALGL